MHSITAPVISSSVFASACFLSTNGSPDPFALLRATLAASAIALDVTFQLAVEASRVLALLCQLLGVNFLLLSLRELASTFALDLLALLTLAIHCSDLHVRSTACSTSGDVLHLLSDLAERIWPARVHGQVALQPASTSPRPECGCLQPA